MAECLVATPHPPPPTPPPTGKACNAHLERHRTCAQPGVCAARGLCHPADAHREVDAGIGQQRLARGRQSYGERSRCTHHAQAEGEDAHRKCGTTSTRRAAERSSSPRRQPRCQQHPRCASRAWHIIVTGCRATLTSSSRARQSTQRTAGPRDGEHRARGGGARVRGPRLRPRPATLRRCRRGVSSSAASTSGSAPGRWQITSPPVRSPSLSPQSGSCGCRGAGCFRRVSMGRARQQESRPPSADASALLADAD